MAATTAPYGSWVSPITSDVVVKESISIMDVSIDPFQEGIIIIKDVEKFVGATVLKEGGGTQDIDNRVFKVRGVFTRMRKICSTNISRRTKIRLYKPVLIYGCET